MNTSTVSNMLGVSQSTIKRWIKHLDLNMERNDQGHYLFSEEDIELLKKIQEQLTSGMVLQEIEVSGGIVRKGKIKSPGNDETGSEKLAAKIEELEKRLDNKADSVTSYQLLQHRREIEELQQEVKTLHERLGALENLQGEIKKNRPADLLVFDQANSVKKPKKKKILSILFGL
ncbi:MerR family transcriptional regulator [Peribacillus glennii]|uniref:Chromosome-anchoring protein RacA n=1 Tax=Peribacillus glennii TaxID=2303991 RepID=A0A372LJH5_9BACI|nr:MerR family transcriptional regulator [Peribacillus glennii]RFU66271.1 MerR family transcriptional regulator [Peribacillus glennii]